jgi:hypothetical protein
MTSISTVTVGLNAQPIAPAPVAGTAAAAVLVINLDTQNTVRVGSSPDQLNLQLGPLASITLTAPVWAAAVTAPLRVGIAPGGSSYSPGSMAISGPVTAEISGPVTAEISGTADVSVTNATLDIVGQGGFMLPGQVSNIYTGSDLTVDAASIQYTNLIDVSDYSSLDIFVDTSAGDTADGAAYCLNLELYFKDNSGDYIISQSSMGVPLGTIYQFTLPVVGPMLAIGFSNIGTTGIITIPVVTVYGSFRRVSKPRWNTYAIPQLANDSSITWEAASSPAGLTSGWICAGNFAPPSGELYGFLCAPAAGRITGYFQTNDSGSGGFSADPVVIDLTRQLRGDITHGTGNNGVLINAPGAPGSPPTLADLNFPMCVPAVILQSSDGTARFECTLIGDNGLM